MRVCFRACVVVLVASCGPGGTTGGGGSGSASEGTDAESSAEAGGAEATSGGEDESDDESDESDGSDATSSSDGGGNEAHECTPFDPRLDEPACTAAGDAEAEPNDQVSQANVVCVDRGYVATISNDADIDVFEFVAPPAAYGGYVVASLTNVDAQATMDLEIRAAIDNSIIVDDGTVTVGESLYVWFATAPGEVYRAMSSRGWNEVGAYTFLAEWFPAPDCYEPNDTRAESKSIPVGETIEAFLLAGHVVADVTDEAFDDWYRVHLHAGAVEVSLREVPAQASAEIELYDAQGASLATEWGFEGEGLTLQTDVPAGEYHVRVGRNHTAATRGLGVDTVPDHFLAPYALAVAQ